MTHHDDAHDEEHLDEPGPDEQAPGRDQQDAGMTGGGGEGGADDDEAAAGTSAADAVGDDD